MSGWFWHSKNQRARTRFHSPPPAARAGNRFAGQPIRRILGVALRVRPWIRRVIGRDDLASAGVRLMEAGCPYPRGLYSTIPLL